MKRTKDYTIEAILFCILLAYLGSLIGCTKSDIGHKCKWEHCPYKTITLTQYPLFAEGEEGSDLYYIDQLHLEYPDLEYDELEEKLFSGMRK